MDNYILVGKTRKAHGVKGGLRLDIEEEFLEDVLKIDVAFLKVQGKFLPFFVEDFEYTNKLIVKFEEVDTPEDALPITSKELYIRDKDISQKEKVTFMEGRLIYGKLKGYTIQDKEMGPVGEILDILEFPQQEMALIDYRNKEVFVPLNKDLIVAIHEADKVVLMNLPEGLLEL